MPAHAGGPRGGPSGVPSGGPAPIGSLSCPTVVRASQLSLNAQTRRIPMIVRGCDGPGVVARCESAWPFGLPPRVVGR